MYSYATKKRVFKIDFTSTLNTALNTALIFVLHLVPYFSFLANTTTSIDTLAYDNNLTQPSDQEQLGVLSEISLSEKGINRILQYGVEKLLPNILASINKKKFPSYEYQPNKKCADSKYLNSLFFWTAWKECPGIPEIWTGNTTWRNFHRPHPVRVQLNDPTLSELSIRKKTLQCQNKKCDLNLKIDKLILQTGVKIISFLDDNIQNNLNDGNSGNNNKIFLDSPNMALHIESAKKEGNAPLLQLKIALHIHKGLDKLIQIEQGESLVRLRGMPKIFITVKGHQEPIDLNLNSLEEYNKIFQDQFPDKAELNKTVILSNALNQNILNDPLLLNYIKDKFLTLIGDALLEKVNNEISQLPYFKQQNIPLSPITLQDILDKENNHLAFIQIYNLLINIESLKGRSSQWGFEKEIMHKEQYHHKLGNYIRHFLHQLDLSTDIKLASELEYLWKRLYQLKEHYQDTYFTTHDVYAKKLKKLFTKWAYQVYSKRSEIIQRNDLHKIMVSIDPRLTDRRGSALTLTMFSAIGDPYLTLSDSINLENADTEHQSFDFSFLLSVEAINNFMKKMHESNQYNLELDVIPEPSIYDNPKDLYIRPLKQPSLSFTPPYYTLHLPSLYCSQRIIWKFKNSEICTFDIDILPKVHHLDNHKIDIETHIDGKNIFFSRKKPLTGLINFLKTTTIVYPFLSNLLIHVLVKPVGEEILSTTLQIPALKINREMNPTVSIGKISTNQNYIQFFGNFVLDN